MIVSFSMSAYVVYVFFFALFARIFHFFYENLAASMHFRSMNRYQKAEQPKKKEKEMH